MMLLLWGCVSGDCCCGVSYGRISEVYLVFIRRNERGLTLEQIFKVSRLLQHTFVRSGVQVGISLCAWGGA